MSPVDQESLVLFQAIHRVVEWLESLLDEDIALDAPAEQSLRVFSVYECEYLSLASRRFLLTLEQQEILTPACRERIIHHAMLLDVEQIELPVIEGITRIVLGQEPDMVSALARISLLMPGGSHSVH